MNDYFKPTYERWFYNPSTFFGNIISTLRWVKWCWQRAFRGWADCDWWNMDAYLVGIILPMLRQLRKEQHGYPSYGEASTAEEWDAILDRMIEGFEAADRVLNDDYYKEIEEWWEASKRDQKVFEDSMKLFGKWFFAL